MSRHSISHTEFSSGDLKFWYSTRSATPFELELLSRQRTLTPALEITSNTFCVRRAFLLSNDSRLSNENIQGTEIAVDVPQA